MAKKKGKAPAVGDKPFLHIHVRAFAHATEDPDKVREALAHVTGHDLEDEDDHKRFDKTTQHLQSEGYYHNPIHIFETELKRNADVKRFWRRLLEDEDLRDRLQREVDERLDDDLVFWVRLDKQAAAEGTLRPTRGQDVIQVRAKLATYPKDRVVGLGFMTSFLSRDGDPFGRQTS